MRNLKPQPKLPREITDTVYGARIIAHAINMAAFSIFSLSGAAVAVAGALTDSTPLIMAGILCLVIPAILASMNLLNQL